MSAVSRIFEGIGEKPPVCDSVRVWKKSADGSACPIKVISRNSDAAISVQRNGKVLKDIPATKKVFIAPDRSREE